VGDRVGVGVITPIQRGRAIRMTILRHSVVKGDGKQESLLCVEIGVFEEWRNKRLQFPHEELTAAGRMVESWQQSGIGSEASGPRFFALGLELPCDLADVMQRDESGERKNNPVGRRAEFRRQKFERAGVEMEKRLENGGDVKTVEYKRMKPPRFVAVWLGFSPEPQCIYGNGCHSILSWGRREQGTYRTLGKLRHGRSDRQTGSPHAAGETFAQFIKGPQIERRFRISAQSVGGISQ
jgi:hypothetical protein